MGIASLLLNASRKILSRFFQALSVFMTFYRLEKCLLPPPEFVYWEKGSVTIRLCSTQQKIAHYAKNFFALAALLMISPFTLAYDLFVQERVVAVRKVPDIVPETIWPPAQRGFATSLFQTSGLGTKWSASPEMKGRSDWDKWMDAPSHVRHPEGFAYKDFFTDVLSDPTAYIAMLKSHNVTAHRFSLEWSVIAPRQGEIDEKAVAVYRNFIQQLLAAGITPSVTLSHFVVPEWFYEAGNFQKIEHADLFVDFGLKAMELFPEVKDWWSFNELGVKAFQQAREVYPTDLPEGSPLSKRIHAAGVATRNMLIAHCKLHTAVREKYPQNTLGVTHQWLTFDMASGNILERLFRYYFEKVSFRPVYGFFKEGHYSFEFPFMANIHFVIPKEEFASNDRFLMRLGVQAYPKPMLKMGWNGGQKNPCMVGSVQNDWFTFGSTCETGNAIMRFGPRWKASEIPAILEEAFAIAKRVGITEFGSDASVFQSGKAGFEYNDAAQNEFLQQLIDEVHRFCVKTGHSLETLFCWSDLRRQMEWENGLECRLGLVDPIVDEKRRMTSWISTAASTYLAKAYAQVQQQVEIA